MKKNIHGAIGRLGKPSKIKSKEDGWQFCIRNKRKHTINQFLYKSSLLYKDYSIIRLRLGWTDLANKIQKLS